MRQATRGFSLRSADREELEAYVRSEIVVRNRQARWAAIDWFRAHPHLWHETPLETDTRSHSPLSRALSPEFAAGLRRALARLPEEARRLLEALSEDVTNEQACVLAGVPLWRIQGGVITRARALLRRELG